MQYIKQNRAFSSQVELAINSAPELRARLQKEPNRPRHAPLKSILPSPAFLHARTVMASSVTNSMIGIIDAQNGSPATLISPPRSPQRSQPGDSDMNQG
eukprot:12687716-Alexandrium_andersonii.AAC.1